MKAKKYPSKEEFSKIYEYRDGKLFYPENHKSKKFAGARAGKIQKAGYKEYRQVKHRGEAYYEHRVIWILHNGDIPEGMQIDHINGCGLDNRIENLRILSVIENNRNKRRSSRGSKSGFTGVTFDRSISKWKAHIEIAGNHKHLGNYDSPEDAYLARREADRLYGFDDAHGASALR